MLIHINEIPVTIRPGKQSLRYSEIVSVIGYEPTDTFLTIEWSMEGASGTILRDDPPLTLHNGMVFFVEDERGYS